MEGRGEGERERERVRKREREGGRERGGREGTNRERVNIPVGMLIALDSVQNKSLEPRIHLVCINQCTIRTGTASCVVEAQLCFTLLKQHTSTLVCVQSSMSLVWVY